MLIKILLLFIPVTSSFLHYNRTHSWITWEQNPEPCNYFESINITDGVRLPNGSIYHHGIQYDTNNYATYNFTYEREIIKTVPNYIRGCVCHLKSCVRICSNVNEDAIKKIKTLIPQLNQPKFAFIEHRPCRQLGYILKPHLSKDDEWTLLPDGLIKLKFDDRIFDYNKFCFLLDYREAMQVTPVICKSGFYMGNDIHILLDHNKIINLYQSEVFAIFILLTLLIYISIEPLRNSLQGKCFMCSIISIIAQRLSFPVLHWLDICMYIAVLSYFGIICNFSWHTVISFNIYRSIGKQVRDDIPFKKYFILVTITTLLQIAILYTFELVYDEQRYNQLIFGSKFCRFRALPYYQNMLIVFIFHTIVANLIYLVLIAKKVYDSTQNFDEVVYQPGTRRFSMYHNDIAQFSLYFRLFIVMGLPLVLRIVFALGGDVFHRYIYIGMDIISFAEGPIIFFLCLTTRRVKLTLIHKYAILRNKFINNSD